MKAFTFEFFYRRSCLEFPIVSLSEYRASPSTNALLVSFSTKNVRQRRSFFKFTITSTWVINACLTHVMCIWERKGCMYVLTVRCVIFFTLPFEHVFLLENNPNKTTSRTKVTQTPLPLLPSCYTWRTHTEQKGMRMSHVQIVTTWYYVMSADRCPTETFSQLHPTSKFSLI